MVSRVIGVAEMIAAYSLISSPKRNSESYKTLFQHFCLLVNVNYRIRFQRHELEYSFVGLNSAVIRATFEVEICT
jgi:hypothetical protein